MCNGRHTTARKGGKGAVYRGGMSAARRWVVCRYSVCYVCNYFSALELQTSSVVTRLRHPRL